MGMTNIRENSGLKKLREDNIQSDNGGNSLKEISSKINISIFEQDAQVNIRKSSPTNILFPIEVIPYPFDELISECKRSLNFPIDYTGTSILSATSTAIGKSASICVKQGWFEYAANYTAIVGNPGAIKSHPIDIAYNPLIEKDRIAIKEYEAELQEYDILVSITKKDIKDIKDIGQIEKPKLKKSILHNFTPEILFQRLSDNSRGCSVVSDELAYFLEGMNNYSKGDQSSAYLSFWSNKGTSIDRVSKPIPLFIPQPFLNIIGGLQPKVLPKLFPTNKIDNGFLQRFLFAYPDYSEKQPINDNQLDERVLNKYSDWINNYISKNPIETDPETDKPISKIYYWSDEAKEYFYQWQKNNTDLVNENAESIKGEIISKFDIHFTRLALIIQIMDNHSSNIISLKSAEAAASLCKYFMNCAFKILENLGNGKVEILPDNKQKIYKALPKEFTTSEANSIGSDFGLNEKFVQRFISDDTLFKKLEHGKYSKK